MAKKYGDDVAGAVSCTIFSGGGRVRSACSLPQISDDSGIPHCTLMAELRAARAYCNGDDVLLCSSDTLIAVPVETTCRRRRHHTWHHSAMAPCRPDPRGRVKRRETTRRPVMSVRVGTDSLCYLSSFCECAVRHGQRLTTVIRFLHTTRTGATTIAVRKPPMSAPMTPILSTSCPAR